MYQWFLSSLLFTKFLNCFTHTCTCSEPLLTLFGTGLLTAVNKNQFRVLNSREFLFHDIADRVALLLHVELLVCFPQNQSADIKKEALIVNTHLIFPHDSSYCFLRLQQVTYLSLTIRFFQQINTTLTFIICSNLSTNSETS